MMTLILYIFTRAIKNARVRKIKDYYSNPRFFDRDPDILDHGTKWYQNILYQINIFSPGGASRPPGLNIFI